MPSRYPKWLIRIAQVLLLVVAVFAVRAWQQHDLARGNAPGFTGIDLQGRPVSLRDHAGRPLLLHFWATWCPVCRLEEAVVADIARDWPVLTVAMQSGDIEDVGAYLRENKLRFPVVVDGDGAIARAYGVRGVPTSFVLDETDRIRYREVGYTTGWGLRLRLYLAQ